jgi:nitrite reductase/ring-hydroxylating ferredoxin subunit
VRTDEKSTIDPTISDPAREGLTGTAPASVYLPLRDGEQITRAPDGRPIEVQPAWRTDFPIDWPQDAYVERRDFMKFMVLTSLAFTVGQFWIAGQNWWRRRRGAPGIARIAALSEVPVGSVRTFTYPTEHDPCVLLRPADDVLLAYNQKCTHLSCAVIPRIDEGVIRCPCHDGLFDMASGRPLAGPPQRPLQRIVLEIRSGEIYATGVEGGLV